MVARILEKISHKRRLIKKGTYWDHHQPLVPAARPLNKLPGKSFHDMSWKSFSPRRSYWNVNSIIPSHLDPETRTISSSTPCSTSSGVFSSSRWRSAHSVPSINTWGFGGIEKFQGGLLRLSTLRDRKVLWDLSSAKFVSTMVHQRVVSNIPLPPLWLHCFLFI